MTSTATIVLCSPNDTHACRVRAFVRYDVIPGPKAFETQLHGKRFEMYTETVLGFNKSGKEVARIQVEEPIYIRPAERVTWL